MKLTLFLNLLVLFISISFYSFCQDEASDSTIVNLEKLDKRPSYEGGIPEFYQCIGKKIKYPRPARKLGIEGTVILQLKVFKDGNIGDLEIIKGVGMGCDAEAIRAIKACDNWTPGTLNNVPVNTQMIIPVAFALTGEQKNSLIIINDQYIGRINDVKKELLKKINVEDITEILTITDIKNLKKYDKKAKNGDEGIFITLKE